MGCFLFVTLAQQIGLASLWFITFKMIEQRPTDSIDHLDTHLSQELSQYRRVNFNLRRKLKEKDLKIW
jgi:hypothetical protein